MPPKGGKPAPATRDETGPGSELGNMNGLVAGVLGEIKQVAGIAESIRKSVALIDQARVNALDEVNGAIIGGMKDISSERSVALGRIVVARVDAVNAVEAAEAAAIAAITGAESGNADAACLEREYGGQTITQC